MTFKITTMVLLLILSVIFSCVQSDHKSEQTIPDERIDKSEINQIKEIEENGISEIPSLDSNASSVAKVESHPPIQEPPSNTVTSPTVEKEVSIVKVVKKDSAVEVDQQAEVKEFNPDPETVSNEKPEITPSSAYDHSKFDALLSQHVSNSGKVDYAAFKKNKSKLDAYLDQLSNNTVQNNWSKAEVMAYWINAYNAFTIKLIVDNYPVNSIMDLHNGNPWDVKWIVLGETTYSLNQIEHDILRPKYKDARIHFAVNCAAKSCPPILNKAWTSENLNTYLDQQAKAFINNPAFNKLDSKKVQLSKIFEWYAEDFGNIIEYLNKYSSTKISTAADVSFIDYDWALNQ